MAPPTPVLAPAAPLGASAPSSTPSSRMPYLGPEDPLLVACAQLHACSDDVIPVVDVAQMAVLAMLGLEPILQCVMSSLLPEEAEL